MTNEPKKIIEPSDPEWRWVDPDWFELVPEKEKRPQPDRPKPGKPLDSDANSDILPTNKRVP
jgi:hypothetical protein